MHNNNNNKFIFSASIQSFSAATLSHPSWISRQKKSPPKKKHTHTHTYINTYNNISLIRVMSDEL
jgi:hypothetical protein